MYKYLIKHGTKLAVLTALAISFLYLILANVLMGDTIIKDVTNGAKYIDKSYFDFGLICMLLLLIVSIGLFIYYSLISLMGGVFKNKKMLIGLFCVIGLFLLLFILNRNDENAYFAELLNKYQVSNNVSAFISSGLIIGCVLFILAIVSIIIAEIRNTIN